MSQEIVNKLKRRSFEELSHLDESLLYEKDEEEEENPGSSEEEDIDNEKEVKSPKHRTPILSDEEESEESSEEDNTASVSNNTPNNNNPLDNNYAVRYKIGDKVSIAYANGTSSSLGGEIDGYDKEGFYRVRWASGLTTNGITDLALLDNVQSIEESRCICGSSNFVDEGKYTICDDCGRKIRESTLSNSTHILTTDTPKSQSKKMIRSIPHPVNTANKPNISETIKSALKKSSTN